MWLMLRQISSDISQMDRHHSVRFGWVMGMDKEGEGEYKQ
jgi:hypothetical protein